MVNHYILRIGDGNNFINSSKYNIWGLSSKNPHTMYFLKNVKENDVLWFVKNKSKGAIIAMAKYKKYEKRINGPLINISYTNEELGWNKINNIDYIIEYKDLYNIYNNNLHINLKGQCLIYKYVDNKFNLNLIDEYYNLLFNDNIVV